jgi:class 3 adenylate cyclase
MQHHNSLVTREELLQNLWSAQYVSEALLSYCIIEARKAVGDNGRTQHVIRTVHGRGYRFVAAVQERPDSTPEQTIMPSDLLLPVTERPDVSQEPLPLVGVAQSLPPLLSWDYRAAEDAEAETAAAMFAAERRQLTVLWCLGVLTPLQAEPLEPEVLPQSMQDVQAVCDETIQRFESRIAQSFDNGFAVYFGHPQAHEDDARRAVHAGLAIARSSARLAQTLRQERAVELAIQVGVHTGVVVIGAVGSDHEQGPLAAGETPQIAAQLASLAAPNTVVVSAATWRLVDAFFAGMLLFALSPA